MLTRSKKEGEEKKAPLGLTPTTEVLRSVSLGTHGEPCDRRSWTQQKGIHHNTILQWR